MEMLLNIVTVAKTKQPHPAGCLATPTPTPSPIHLNEYT